MVRVSGELDLATAPAVVSACRTAGTPLVFDLSGITFIDSAGLRGLLEAAGEDRAPVVVSPSAVVRRLIEAAGLEDAITVEEAEGDPGS